MAVVGVVIAGIIFCLFLFLYYLQTKDKKDIIDKIPGPPTIPILGNAHMFKPSGGEFLELVMMFYYQFKDHKICRFWLGNEAVVLLYTPETVETLLSSNKHITKSNLYDHLHPWLGTGLLTSTGDKWRRRRKMLTPSFHFRILNDFLQVFNEQSQILVERLEERVDKGQFDIFPYITLCALDIICDTAMGTNVAAQKNTNSEYVRAIHDITEVIHKRQKSPWLWPPIIFNHISAGKTHNQCLEVLHSFTEKVIRDRSAEFKEAQEKQGQNGPVDRATTEKSDLPLAIGKRKRLAFLDMLLYAAQEERDLDFHDIREEVDTFMFEGHDTTAAAANWATHLLGANPEVQRRAQQEIDAVMGDSDRDVTTEDIKEMKYLECVVKEALRLYPSVPLFGRTLVEDVNIGGYEVPKGTTALVVTHALHRDPKHFPDPEKFDPERWMYDNAAGRHPYSYVPFSAGPRNCIGQRFAMNEEKVILSYILRKFNIESCQERRELRPVAEIILRPENGIHVKLTRREK